MSKVKILEALKELNKIHAEYQTSYRPYLTLDNNGNVGLAFRDIYGDGGTRINTLYANETIGHISDLNAVEETLNKTVENSRKYNEDSRIAKQKIENAAKLDGIKEDEMWKVLL